MSSIFDGIGDDSIEQLDENLRKWFKEKWVRFGPDGKIRGACARGDDSEGKPKCLPQKKAQNLGKKGRKYAASKKRREDPNPERTGKAKNVATKKKTNEGVPFDECPKCRGPIVHESMLNEKQDACYHKVKSRYKVWPSAYASGALVQCRKKGASNWGTGGKKNESNIMKGIVDEAGSPAQQAAIAINMKKKGEKPKNVDEAKAKPYVKPFNENGKQVGWKSSDGYHVKYWQMFAKDSAIKHAKISPDEVQEDYTGEFATEKTPAINPYGGLKDNQFRGAISEEPTTSGPIGTQPGGWRKYKPKPAGELDESRMHQYNINDAVKKVQEYHRTQGSPYRGAATRLLNALYQWQNTEDDNIVTRAQLLRTPNMGKQAMALLDNLLGNISKDESPYDQNRNQAIVILDSLRQALAGDDMQSILDLMRELKNSIGNMDRLSYKRVREDTAYAGGMGQGGNAGESYRKFKPKSAGTFKEDELDEACWKGYHKEGNKKMFGKTYPNCVKNTNEEEQLDEKCWDTHKQVGMKNKGGRQVPNCVPKESSIMKGLKSL
jgi:hypothetical protein